MKRSWYFMVAAPLLSFVLMGASPSYGKGFEAFFESVSDTRWEPDHTGRWYRRYVAEHRTYIVTVLVAPIGVVFRSWEMCSNGEVLDEVVWQAGEETGLRIDCNGR